MKQYDEMSVDEQDRFLDWAEAEYCPICAGTGSVRRTQVIAGPMGVEYQLPAWQECHRCKGTGRA